ncbi:MAG TPA: hypothetical protein VF711_03665, partial [Acidimicrobiales bacterium]
MFNAGGLHDENPPRRASVVVLYGIFVAMVSSRAAFSGKSKLPKRRRAVPPESRGEAPGTQPHDEEWSQFVASAAAGDGELAQAPASAARDAKSSSARRPRAEDAVAPHVSPMGGPKRARDVQPSTAPSESGTGLPAARTSAKAQMDYIVTMVRAQVEASAERTSQAIEEVRDQLASTWEDTLVRLAEEQRLFQKWVVEEQTEALGQVLAGLRAERDETLTHIRTESDNLRDHLTTLLHEETAALQQQFLERQRTALDEVLARGQAERDETMTHIGTESENLREHLTAVLHHE